MLRDNESILQFFLGGLAYLSAPIIVVFMVGVFWRGATSAGAVTTIVTAPALCYAAQNMRQLIGWGPTQTSIVYWLPIAVGASAVMMLGVSLCTKRKDPALLKGLLWTRGDTLTLGTELLRRRDATDAAQGTGHANVPGIWSDHRILATFAFILLIAVLWFLR